MDGQKMNGNRKPIRFFMAVTLSFFWILAGCQGGNSTPTALPVSLPVVTSASPTSSPTLETSTTPSPSLIASETSVPTPTITPTFPPTPTPNPVPNFSHIFMVLLENREFGSVVGNSSMPVFNGWAKQYTLLTQEFAVTHPSLPNYLALIGGDTFKITTDCTDCFIQAPSLPDQLEAAGKTWMTYQEDLPSPCFIGSGVSYAQKHNPFIYFDPIRLDETRCKRGIVPLTQLLEDEKLNQLPDFAMLVPNICNDGHDCDVDKPDAWLDTWISPLINRDPRVLIIITWDEGQGDHGCCGLNPAGGRVGTVLISPLAKPAFQDATPYTHYSLLKTIETAWNLPWLGHAADDQNVLITAPWEK